MYICIYIYVYTCMYIYIYTHITTFGFESLGTPAASAGPLAAPLASAAGSGGKPIPQPGDGDHAGRSPCDIDEICDQMDILYVNIKRYHKIYHKYRNDMD